jgi:hypothetical protein
VRERAIASSPSAASIPDTYASDSRRLVETVRARGGTAEVLELEGMTHADTAHALGDATSPLFQAVMQQCIVVGMVSEPAAATS